MSRRAWLGACLAAACSRTEPRDTSAKSSSADPIATAAPSSPRSRAELDRDAVPAPSPFEMRFPELARRLPRVHLGRFPSALEAMPALGLELGAARFWVKRDDLASEVFGGGKARKLELLLGEAIATGHDTVVTFGGAGSNQAVATARFGAQLGMRVVLFLAPQVRGPHVRAALLAMQRAGAELRFTPSVSAGEAEVATWSKSGRRAYVIPPGASSPLGDLAFVEAGIELGAQLATIEGAKPTAVHIACGTGGSAAGLAVGLHVTGARARVVAVRASSPGTSSTARLQALLTYVVARARSLDPTFPAIAPNDVALTIDGSELGAGYGHPTAIGREMIARARRLADLRLEPVYTAKALAAIAARSSISGDQAVILWATQHGGDLGDEGDVEALPAALRPYARA